MDDLTGPFKMIRLAITDSANHRSLATDLDLVASKLVSTTQNLAFSNGQELLFELRTNWL